MPSCPPEAGKAESCQPLAGGITMICVYVIKSMQKKFRYVGITNKLQRRIKDHNSGKNKSTAPYKPFKLILKEECNDYLEARKREQFLKSGQRRKFLDMLKIKRRGGGMADAMDSKSIDRKIMRVQLPPSAHGKSII